MMTTIEWTDETWNPTDGCEVCSPGCANCYAMRFAGRFAKPGERYHGLVSIGKNKRAIWTGESRLDAGKLAKPLHWRRPRRIFVNSMSDLFYEGFSNEQIAAVFGVMAACPQHTFQILTKRAKRMREWFEWIGGLTDRPGRARERCAEHAIEILGGKAHGREQTAIRIAGSVMFDKTPRPWPLPNVWLGVSVENQDAADERIPELLATPAAVRFLSCEPLLGEVDLILRGSRIKSWDEDWKYDTLNGCEWASPHSEVENGSSPRLDLVIAGCESGPGARPCSVASLRSLRDQCSAAGVPFFLKQATEDVEQCTEGCGQRVRYSVTSPINADASCGCTVEGAETCSPTGVMFGPGSNRKPGGVIGLPYLDGVQHKAFPDTKEIL